MPKRPLLLVYLASEGLLAELIQGGSYYPESRGKAWLDLTRMIARREADQVDIDELLAFRFFGRLASVARASPNGMGNFSPQDVERCFFEATGRSPTDDDRKVLFRVPGLGASGDGMENRTFVDGDFVDALSAVELVEYISAPYLRPGEAARILEAQNEIGELGAECAYAYCCENELTSGRVKAAIQKSVEQGSGILTLDLLKTQRFFEEAIDISADIESIVVKSIDLTDPRAVGEAVNFHSCLIDSLSLGSVEENVVNYKFFDCVFGVVRGRTSAKDLPTLRFTNCTFEGFENEAETTAEFFKEEIPTALAVLVSVLRKVFIQSTSGRLEHALFRGPAALHVPLVTEVIEILRKEGFIYLLVHRGNRVWHPVRGKFVEALEIVSRPFESNSRVVSICRKL